MASRFRLWCPGLIPEEALTLVALRTLEPALARKPWPEGQASLLSGEPLPVLEEARGRRMGKGVARRFVHLSVMATCFCLRPRFLQKTFPAMEYLTPVLQGVSSQPETAPFLGPFSEPHFLATSTPSPCPLHQKTHDSDWVWRAVACHSLLTDPCFPQAGYCLPSILLRPLSALLVSLPWMGFSESGNFSSLSVPYQGCWSFPISSSSSSSFFFFLLSYLVV